ncbi:double-strand break repair protein AddB [Hoeflea prorocentri]|uniref:Double-strand break repair protein AddB n=1 Tax=Hoeflea prorocentri TaxID=1922333 RepID=A0A9X3UM80_9HYPH|nr:double-strand break repair protein AddB [Hoeflea prorocentri]MCY6383126.1 double-strand break repair protein AddB [Hoeflea prorocentri]MDA5400926.1 double-strand break repair protein AddB [Hoeflea prorocentri]
MSRPRLFTIAPGIPFLGRLAEALCNGELIDGFSQTTDNPLALAGVTIYVPTRRAARALRSEFVDAAGYKSAILPTVRTLGEAEDDAEFLEENDPALFDLSPPVGATERLLELAQLIMAWKRNLPKAVSEFHGDNRLIAPANPADAIWLARGLAELLEAMETEDRPWSALGDVVGEDHAVWWQLTLEFLKIAAAFWPDRLGELKRSDPSAHRNAVLLREAERLSDNPPDGPVIIAGSTGSIPATAELMKVVASLPLGAVVLPGLDTGLEADVWALVEGAREGERLHPATCAHPQYGLAALLRRLRATREDVLSLGAPAPAVASRNMLVSRALMPAEATADWASFEQPDTLAAFTDVELIEASNEREEALAVAAAIRLAADRPADTEGSPPQIALVTPDRNLARRVASELQRFGIEADDSGGTPLALSPQGTLLQLLLQSVFAPDRSVALAGLLKHPLARFGMNAGAARRSARSLERIALRGGTGGADPGGLLDLFERRLGERLAEKRHAPNWQRRLSEEDIAAARHLAEAVDAAFQPLASLKEGTVADWACETAHVIEHIAGDQNGDLTGLWGDEAGEKLASLLSAAMEDRSGFSCNGPEWMQAAPAVIAGELVKPRAGGHPHIFIWGALEARLQHVDTLILAGLNEGTWPGSIAGDPFLSRAMKAAVGLEPPERRIGLAAHDFQMGLGVQHVVLSRSARAANAPTVASRWLQRLSAVLGKEETGRLRARGENYLRWAAMLDEGKDRPLATRPAPKPPKDLQPKRYSFSEVRTLRRDPYAIYAKRVLRLDPAEPLLREPGPAERGTLYHRILERFIEETGDLDASDALEGLNAIADREFATENLPDHLALIWRAHFDKVATAFVDWEQGRSGAVTARFTESRAQMDIAACNITLSGMADRIDLDPQGRAEIFDYKTGSSPSRKVAWTLLDPQLPLEAAALRAGAFEGLDAPEPVSLAYIRLKPDPVLKVEAIEGTVQSSDKTKSATDLAEESIERLSDLVMALADGSVGFASQVIPDPTAIYGRDYDHLARLREWSSADAGDDGGGDS